MLRKIDSAGLGTSDLGWLRSRFHFSFAEYHDPEQRPLRRAARPQRRPGRARPRVRHAPAQRLRDPLLRGGRRADPRRQHGQRAHADARGGAVHERRHGVLHSEHNRGDKTLRFLQIWIFPDEKGHEPAYGDHRFDWEARRNRWLADRVGARTAARRSRSIRTCASAPWSSTPGRELGFAVGPERQAYLLQIEGASVGERRRSGRARRARDRGRGRRGQGRRRRPTCSSSRWRSPPEPTGQPGRAV